MDRPLYADAIFSIVARARLYREDRERWVLRRRRWSSRRPTSTFLASVRECARGGGENECQGRGGRRRNGERLTSPKVYDAQEQRTWDYGEKRGERSPGVRDVGCIYFIYTYTHCQKKKNLFFPHFYPTSRERFYCYYFALSFWLSSYIRDYYITWAISVEVKGLLSPWGPSLIGELSSLSLYLINEDPYFLARQQKRLSLTHSSPCGQLKA